MNGLLLQSVAQVSVERVLNSLPEGVLIALSAWLLLRMAGRQNAGTRFAVWLMALLAVAGLPFFSGLAGDGPAAQGAVISARFPHLTIPHIPVPHIAVPLAWAVTIFALWSVAACVATARLAVGLWQVRSIRRSATAIDLSEFDPAVRAVAEKMCAVVVATSERVRVPAAIGFRKPMIVLPAWALRDLSAEELKAILLHEYAHLQRRDDWTNLLQKAVRAVFFFHPAVWWIDAKLSLEREMACDDAVLAETGNPRVYASCLISLLEKSCARRGWTMAQAAVGRAREASLRIAQILDGRRLASTRVWKPALGFAGALSMAGFAVLLCAPRLVVFAPRPSTAGPVATNSWADAGEIVPGALPKGAVIPASLRSRGPLAAWGHSASARAAGVRRVASSKMPDGKRLKVALATPERMSTDSMSSEPMRMADGAQQPMPAVRETLASLSVGSEPGASDRVAVETLVQETWMEAAPVSAKVVADGQMRSPAVQASMVSGEAADGTVVLVRTAQYVETDADGRPVHIWRVVLIQHGGGALTEGFLNSLI
jgi:beta-lactamase regulating signal transducer with metallopeptidase domain